MSGTKIVIVDNTRESVASLYEGKRATSFEVYTRLCEELYNGKGDDHLFAHAFLTMECNIMARSDNCVNIHVQHIQWRSDNLIYCFGTLKGNQTGDRANDHWHQYSNPNNPTIFPVLALAKYFFSHPVILTTNSKLLPGYYQYEIFLKIFHKIVNDNLEEFQSIGVEKRTLGYHSFRKGSITIVASGCTVSPPVAYIFLRACLSMGPIKY